MNLPLLRQALVALWLSLIGLQKRWWSTLNAVLGTAAVVGVLVAILSIAAGYTAAMRMTGSDDNVLVMRSGARSEMESSLTGEQAALIRNAAPIARDADGQSLAAAEVYAIANVDDRRGQSMNVAVRGVEASSFAIRPNLRIVDGRAPTPGRREILVGRQAQASFKGLGLGQTFRFADNDWQVVGTFAAGGGVIESEIWAEAAMLQSAYKRGDSVQVVFARLVDNASIATLDQALKSDARLTTSVESERAYYEAQAGALSKFVKVIGYGVASLMGLGAAFAALNTGYAAITARAREIGVLDALGMSRRATSLAIVAEAIILAMTGAALGSLAAYWLYHGKLASTLFFSRDFSQVVFTFQITPGLLFQAGLGAALIGLVAGLGAARQTRRLPLTQVLAERH